MARYSRKSTSMKKSGEEAMAIAQGTHGYVPFYSKLIRRPRQVSLY